MSDDARQYVRAAQEAELRGDVPHAVELLMKAAALYRTNGQTSRALQMLRHANRLDGSRTDLAEEVRRLEWLPDQPLLRAVDPLQPPDTAEEDRALSSLDEFAAPSREKRLIERGPTLADPQLNAWCSFCCRPRAEVGDLVAGPAGAFVCQTCLQDSAKLLGVELAGAPARPALRAVARPPSEDDSFEPIGQEPAARALDGALRRGMRCILLIGPEGSGKTTWLRALERKGLGVYVPAPDALADAPQGDRLLVDAAERARPDDASRLLALVKNGAELILAVRGEPGAPSLVLTNDDAELPLLSTRALVEATRGLLGAELAEHVEAVAALGALQVDALEEIARRLLLARRQELELSDALVQALAAEAARSGRGGHELRALLRRIPAGTWTVRAPAAEPATPEPRTGSKKRRSPGAKKKGE